MRFKIDENLPVEVAELLQEAHHDAMMVTAQGLMGEDDNRIIDVCLQEERTLITLDLDFADARAYPPRQFKGIIVLRLQTQGKKHLLAVFSRLLPLLEREELYGHLWIVEESRIRIRGDDE